MKNNVIFLNLNTKFFILVVKIIVKNVQIMPAIELFIIILLKMYRFMKNFVNRYMNSIMFLIFNFCAKFYSFWIKFEKLKAIHIIWPHQWQACEWVEWAPWNLTDRNNTFWVIKNIKLFSSYNTTLTYKIDTINVTGVKLGVGFKQRGWSRIPRFICSSLPYRYLYDDNNIL